MFIALSFVGTLPSYIIESVHQIRCFFNGDVYLITNDLTSQYIEKLYFYNINIINYQDVKSDEFDNISNKNSYKFLYVNDLVGREQLFLRSIERFFLVNNLMLNKNIGDCLFIELDNLIYDDPRNWLDMFSRNELCYMYDNDRRFASGIMYIKNSGSIKPFLDTCLDIINNTNEFMNEMTFLAVHYENNKDNIQILPTYWIDSTVPFLTYSNHNMYSDSIFDSAGMGIFLLGVDPYHTYGKVVLGKKSQWSALDYTDQKFEWKIDDKGRNRPYIWNGEKWLLINNLHVHSKELVNGLSISM